MPKKSLLKPSGYDVVIRNRNAIQDINRKLKKASGTREKKLIDEKDRLMWEMWKACPHDSVAYNPGYRTSLGPDPLPLRFCTSCGFDEASRTKRFKTLTPRDGRTIAKMDDQAFAAKLGQTLRWTGINI